jgi:steroid delta-isomerase-like uncharacterized protein
MSSSREQVMSLVQRLLGMMNSHNFKLVPEIYAEDYCGTDMASHSRHNGPVQVARALERVCRAFPDLTFSIEQTIFENDRVALYWTARGTHQGTLFNIPATGRPVLVNGVSMMRVADDKIAQGVHLWDMAELLRAVGLLPELEQRAPLDTITLKDAMTICG